MPTTVTDASFREAFPAFSDDAQYPPGELAFWLTLAPNLHDDVRYGPLLDAAVMLFIAHNLTLEFNARAAAVTGQSPGGVVGAITSASVDKVSYSRDASAAMSPGAGHWNLTHYGLRWLQLQRLLGAGPVQVGVPVVDCGGTGAWPGPMPMFW